MTMSGLYTAASSIRAHQAKLSVISNNIANVNTLGFKSSGVNFANVFANTITGGSASNGMSGGTNPMQIGNGVYLSDIAQNFSQGGTVYTGRSSDLMINGNGMFVVERTDLNSGPVSSDFYLTRAGNFSIDDKGYLNTDSGFHVRGSSQLTGNSPASVGRIQVPLKFMITKDYDASGTVIGSHLSPEGTDATTIDAAKVTGTDKQITASVELRSYSVGNDGTITVVYSNGDSISVRTNQATVAANPNDPTQWKTEVIHKAYDGGTLASGNVTTDDAGSLDQIGASAVFDGGIGLGVGGTGMEGMQLRLQLANVVNPAGLLNDGNNNYTPSPNSGELVFGSAGNGSRGKISAGALESSNVDISTEFTNMITTQRGLDAAARALRTNSEVLQTIIQMV